MKCWRLRQPNKDRSNNYGFSLVELTLVLALVALIALLVGANSSVVNRLFVRAEVEKLYALCRYLQQMARVENKPQELTFDVRSKKYTYRGITEYLPAHIDFGFIPGTKGPPSAPNTIVDRPVTFVHNHVVFHPTGIIKAGTIYLVDATRNHMYALSAPISQVSYLRKYQYTGKWQEIT